MTDRGRGLPLTDWLRVAQEAAHRGAEELEHWRTRFSVREKGRADLVTEADFAAQQAIRSCIHARFPDHGFLGEEDVQGKDKLHLGIPVDAPPTWIVDPLDGTANYVHDCPCYCVSIGLVADGELVVGVIYDPRQNEMFSAARGQGATLNQKPIRVSTVPLLEQALMATGFPPDPEAQERNLHWWRVFSYKAQALRRTGSTALNLAYVACGRYDAYWAFDNYAWDVAAGSIIVQEAGGTVTRTDGSTLDIFRPDILATNSHLHDVLHSCLNTQQPPST